MSRHTRITLYRRYGCTCTLQSPASGKKGKASPGGKSKAPPPAEAPPTEPTVAVETPEQLVQRQRKCKLYKEHKAAIEKEGKFFGGMILRRERERMKEREISYHLFYYE